MQTVTPQHKLGQLKLNSRLSFKPVLDTWRRKIAESSEGLADFYRELLEKVSQVPQLSEPIDDLSVLEQHKKLVDLILATVFPLTLSEDEDYFAVALPFSYQTIYSSRLFRKQFLKEKGSVITVEEDTAKNLSTDKVTCAYEVVLSKLYKQKVGGHINSVHQFTTGSGLAKYMELELDTRFVNVIAKGPLPELPEGFTLSCTDEMAHYDMLCQILPLDLFEFEGIVLIKIKDVTEEQIINEIKNELLALNSFTDANTFQNLQNHIENLIGSSGVKIGLTPFFKINRHFVFSDQHITGSMLFKNLTNFQEKNNVYQQLKEVFKDNNDLLVIPEITDTILDTFPFLQPIYQQGGRSVIICPLLNEKELLGTLEIISDQPAKLNNSYTHNILPAIPLFVLALEKSAKNLANEIDNTIKEQFTAVQSSVEWRFTEAALKYITQRAENEDAKIEPIIFENVYPLYGAIDLRNSSIERNEAIQQDLTEQLMKVGEIIRKAQQFSPFPLFDEINFKINKYLNAVSNIMLSDDEFSIHSFLKKEVSSLFNHMKNNIPEVQKDIIEYIDNIDLDLNTWNKNRKQFEQSITYINNSIARFIDIEQEKAQKIFPHYFERFVTDGVDFNIYIGRSISPQRQFDPFYLKNLKMWQITTLAKAAMLSKQLESRIAKPLQTTQLILAHSQPISISFRTAERKFDVDGAYNIRYEIIKKRIDKVHIKDSNERLTQPGKLAIVYTQPNEAAEYLEFIEYMQSQELFTGEVESFDLEDLQGVSGLKALRVGINLEAKVDEKKDIQKYVAKVK